MNCAITGAVVFGILGLIFGFVVLAVLAFGTDFRADLVEASIGYGIAMGILAGIMVILVGIPSLFGGEATCVRCEHTLEYHPKDGPCQYVLNAGEITVSGHSAVGGELCDCSEWDYG